MNVKREDIKTAFDRIAPDIPAKERMLQNVLHHSTERKANTILCFNVRKAIPALALVIVLAGGILTYGLKDKLSIHGTQGNARPEIAQYDATGTNIGSGTEDMAAPLLHQFQMGGRHYIRLSDSMETFGFPSEIGADDVGQEIAVIEKSPDKSLVGCEVFRYIPAGCEAVVVVKRNNAYELFRFFTFESYNNNQDEDAIEYLKLYGIEKPEDIAGIQFIVHTESSKLGGFTDIRGEITDRDGIADFYKFYSVLKNASNRYFEKLFGYPGSVNEGETETDRTSPNQQEIWDTFDGRAVDPVPPDDAPDSANVSNETGRAYPGYTGNATNLPLNHAAEESIGAVTEDAPPVMIDQPVSVNGYDTPVSVFIDPGEGISSSSATTQGSSGMGNMGATSVAPSQGSAGNALADAVTIRIYNQNGVYYDSMYYRNIGFISRYEITEEFAALIERHIK